MSVTIEQLRANLKPYNPGFDCIKLTYQYNYGYVPEKDVYEALDALEQKLRLVAAGIDEMNALEKLGLWLLIDSAGLNKG
jgi:hypothetical protein